MNPAELSKYRKVQNIAKATMRHMAGVIRSGMTEREVAEAADAFMKSKGVERYWYYNAPPLISVGKRRMAASGKHYVPSEEKIKATDLVKVEIHPELDGYWSDHSRTFVVFKGRVVQDPHNVNNPLVKEFSHGIRTQNALHRTLLQVARPGMKFEQLWRLMTEHMARRGYTNLDFKGTLGHSIEREINARKYLMQGNRLTIPKGGLFTFEPQLSRLGGEYCYAREEIYYFDKNGKLKRL